jgi:hypothetical protein
MLIAGSLYWRNEPHREAWRKTCLNTDVAGTVKVPIRYGCLSDSTKTYTMVYAPGSPDGQAKIIGCLGSVSATADIVEHAKALWTAIHRGAGLASA